MKRLKKMLTMGLAAMMAMSAMSVCAMANDNGIASAPPIAETNGVTSSTTINLNTNESSQIISWPVYSGYGYWKIHVTNTSESVITVRILKGSPSGQKVGETMVIPVGGDLPFYCEEDEPLSTGAYYLEVSSDGNHNLSGQLYYKFGTDYESLF